MLTNNREYECGINPQEKGGKTTRQVEAYCPLDVWDCPYYHAGGKCAIENPVEECEDYMSFYYDNYVEGENPYTNEPRTAFE